MLLPLLTQYTHFSGERQEKVRKCNRRFFGIIFIRWWRHISLLFIPDDGILLLLHQKEVYYMKTRNFWKFAAILAIFSVFIGFITCDNSNGTPTAHVHDWDEWTVTTPATCTTAGEETRTCKLDPTHTETQAIAALGHDWGDWEVTTPPTTTTEGVETRMCKHDATHKETQAIDKLPDTQTHDQSETITSFEDKTITIQGVFTNTEWNNILDKIRVAINNDPDYWEVLLTSFSHQNFNIIVEKEPVYANYSTTKAGNTIRINFSILNNPDNLKNAFQNAIEAIFGNPRVPESDPNTATITLFEGKTATVEGFFTKAELDTAAEKIEDAIKANFEELLNYPEYLEIDKANYRKCEFIIVEKNPTYTNYKTIGDGKTIYLNSNLLDKTILAGAINAAINSMGNNKTEMAKVTPKAIQPKHNRVHAG
ncbi:MAG: hypothetical protein LBC52_06585 [Treponema sp.]|jgi:hypothetical protein|nr:hypothetical protein [Treponema sp.]